MSILKGKHILLGVTGGIAAYKSASLVRALIKKGVEVRVVMTSSACDFITPLTLATLSKHPVVLDFIKTEYQTVEWNSHVDLAIWADMMLIAPATANTISKMSCGNCDNLLTVIYESCKSPVYIAPAMDLDMYKHPTTKNNLEQLKRYGNIIIPPETGELASGLYGEGRMCEPDNIIAFMENAIASTLPLRGKSILITAGPTHEYIDPVRFISNNSSGKMGYGLAQAAAKMGANVRLISGPTHQVLNDNLVACTHVTSAKDMFDKVRIYYGKSDILIMAAAVADYTPKKVSSQKIKKTNAETSIELTPTMDILKYLGHHKKSTQFLMGFALETENAIENAIKKIKSKQLDAIVVNSLEDEGAGFSFDTNKITIIDDSCQKYHFELKSKKAVANDIMTYICKLVNIKNEHKK